MFRLDNRGIYLAPLLEQYAWLEHGFGARSTAGWPDPATTATIHQVHSDRVVEAERPGRAGEADAMITSQTGLMLTVRTADCLPMLIADPKNRAVAAVHAGWRGTVAGIAPKTVEAMIRRFGSCPEDLAIAIGPAIAPCCFEVGPEVAVQFQKYFPERRDLASRVRVDLVESNRRQLRQVGVRPAQIVACGLCTCCDAEQFHSYRRDREAAGRMLSSIGIRP